MADKDDDVVAALGAPPVGCPQVPGMPTQRKDTPGEVGDPSPPISRGGRSGTPPTQEKGPNPSVQSHNIYEHQCQEDYDERQVSQVIAVSLITQFSL